MKNIRKIIPYFLPTKIIFGQVSLELLPELGIGQKLDNVFLVVGRRALQEAGVVNRIKNLLLAVSAKTILYKGVGSGKTVDLIEDAKNRLTKSGSSLVIAAGGGNVLDVGKSIAILAKNNGSLIDSLEKRNNLDQEGLPLIAIPTTSGTGSEVTPWATVWQPTGDGGAEKRSLSSPLIFPKIALLDPELTLTLSPYYTATTGMDALSQAIESFWSINSSLLSDIHAREAITTANQNLEKAVTNPDNVIYRERMMRAALEAGRAFSQTKTTIVHSVSYPMTSYFNVPHGLACGLTLASFFEYNSQVTDSDCQDARGSEFVKRRIHEIARILGTSSPEEGGQRIRDLMTRVKLPTRLKEAGVDDIEVVVEKGFHPDRAINNPRKVTKRTLTEILRRIY